MKVDLIEDGAIVRTIYNVRGIEEPTGSKHPASWWLLMQTTDTPVPVGRRFQLLISEQAE